MAALIPPPVGARLGHHTMVPKRISALPKSPYILASKKVRLEIMKPLTQGQPAGKNQGLDTNISAGCTIPNSSKKHPDIRSPGVRQAVLLMHTCVSGVTLVNSHCP